MPPLPKSAWEGGASARPKRCPLPSPLSHPLPPRRERGGGEGGGCDGVQSPPFRPLSASFIKLGSKIEKSVRRNLAGPGVAIVGPGRVGQALGRLLREAGVRVRFVAARRMAKARRAAKFIGAGRPVPLDAPELTKAKVILIATSDGAIATVARDLAKLRSNWSGKIILHTCGSLPASILAPLKRSGAAVGSLHPFQTIPTAEAGVRSLRNCSWAIEGDPAAERIAARWVKALGGAGFRIRPSQKPLYHLAASLVCPTLLTLMDRSLRLLKRSGVPLRIARPMLGRFVSETADNFRKLGARRALTGPAVRGDWTTIRKHLAALRRYSPEMVPVYGALLPAIIRLAGRRPPSFLRNRTRP